MYDHVVHKFGYRHRGSSRTSLQVLVIVFVLRPQVLDNISGFLSIFWFCKVLIEYFLGNFICLCFLICCIRQYPYWLNPDVLDNLQPVSRVFYTRQHSTWVDADICVHNWRHQLCHYHHYASCIFILEISHHALCPVVWFSRKWVLICLRLYLILCLLIPVY